MTTKDYYNHLQPCDRGLSSLIKNRGVLRVSDILEWGHVSSLHPDLVSNVVRQLCSVVLQVLECNPCDRSLQVTDVLDKFSRI